MPTDPTTTAACHCGRPVHVYDEPGMEGFTRGLCLECSAVRCDVAPGPCVTNATPDNSMIGAHPGPSFYPPLGSFVTKPTAELVLDCPGERKGCRCDCHGCKFHCSAHNPSQLWDDTPEPQL